MSLGRLKKPKVHRPLPSTRISSEGYSVERGIIDDSIKSRQKGYIASEENEEDYVIFYASDGQYMPDNGETTIYVRKQ